MFVVAHAGHWLVNLMYFAPVVVVFGWIAVQSRAGRREERNENTEEKKP